VKSQLSHGLYPALFDYFGDDPLIEYTNTNCSKESQARDLENH